MKILPASGGKWLAMRLIPSSMFKIALTLLAAAIIVVAGCATHHDGPCPFELSVFAPAGHSVSGTFMLCFSLTNVSTAAINPMIAKSTLKVNGKEFSDFAKGDGLSGWRGRSVFSQTAVPRSDGLVSPRQSKALPWVRCRFYFGGGPVLRALVNREAVAVALSC